MHAHATYTCTNKSSFLPRRRPSTVGRHLHSHNSTVIAKKNIYISRFKHIRDYHGHVCAIIRVNKSYSTRKLNAMCLNFMRRESREIGYTPRVSSQLFFFVRRII